MKRLDDMSNPLRLAVLAVVAIWVSTAAPAWGQAPPYVTPPGPTGTYVLVPHGTGYVYVPIDAYGNPINVPGVPPAPAAPPSPSAPAAPPTPSQPFPPDFGYLRTEVEPTSARVFVDSQFMGWAQEFSGPQGFLTLAPGPHHVEIIQEGYAPLQTVVHISPQQTYALRATLDRETSGTAPPAVTPRPPASRRGGYRVIPPSSQREDIPRGGGYYVVPRQ
ncbi:MAG: PEGA domain-containing protein [Candidatus Methylomirabilia bacterium]